MWNNFFQIYFKKYFIFWKQWYQCSNYFFANFYHFLEYIGTYQSWQDNLAGYNNFEINKKLEINNITRWINCWFFYFVGRKVGRWTFWKMGL